MINKQADGNIWTITLTPKDRLDNNKKQLSTVIIGPPNKKDARDTAMKDILENNVVDNIEDWIIDVHLGAALQWADDV